MRDWATRIPERGGKGLSTLLHAILRVEHKPRYFRDGGSEGTMPSRVCKRSRWQ